MSEILSQECPQCGTKLSQGTPVTQCPKCLLVGVPDLKFDGTADMEATVPTPGTRPITGAPARQPSWDPPSAVTLQAMLPAYEVMTLLGRGGMGAVYKGRQVALDRFVAIKVLNPEIGGEEDDFAGRFNLEARAMAKLKHPGIVSVYDCGQTPKGLLYFVMEFVEGMDVQRMIATEGRLHSANAIAIAAHVCEALQYAHDRGIIHRDIKPANIMVDHEGHVKVADFGLVKMANASATSSFTISGTVMGTPQYMAPEVLIFGSEVDHRADIYAVGVMLYQMLTGRVPQGVFELPSLKVRGLDPRLDCVVARAMREDRDQRYQSAADLHFDLINILTQPVPQTIPPQHGPTAPEVKQAAPGKAVRAAVVVEEEEDGDYDNDSAALEMLRDAKSANTTLLVLGVVALLTIGGLAVFLANRKTGDIHNFQQTITSTSTSNTYFTQIIANGATTLEELQAISEIRAFGSRYIGITRDALSWNQVQEVARRTGAQIMTVDEGEERQRILAWVEQSYGTQVFPSAVWVQEHGEPRSVKSKEVAPTPDRNVPQKALLEWRISQTTGGGTAISAQSKAASLAETTASESKIPNHEAKVRSPKSTTEAPIPTLQSWTDATGRVIQAIFLRLEGEAVVIEKDGKSFHVPFANLSPASIELARKLGAPAK